MHASQNPKTASLRIARTPRKLWQPTMRQRRGNVEATARLHAGGDGALCAGDASGEEDTEPRERQERQDQGTDVRRLGRVRELPLGINCGER